MKSSFKTVFLLIVLLMVFDIYATSNLAPPPNIRVTNIPQLNNEEQVWICPTDSNIVIAVWRDFRLGYRQVAIGRSTDGGQTWTDSLIPPSMQMFGDSSWQSDPTLTVDRIGNLYIAVVDIDHFGSTDGRFIAFYKSTDKGVTWTGPVTTVPSLIPGVVEDKEFITVDRTGGAHDGNLYCAWTRINLDDEQIMVFARSVDGGASFEDTIVFGPPQVSICRPGGFNAGLFANPVVSADGSLHIFWLAPVWDSIPSCRIFNKIKQVVSIDGGQSFSDHNILLNASAGYLATNGTEIYASPAADADISSGPFNGHVYVAFPNWGPEDQFITDVDLIRSTDNGETWSDRVQVNDDANSYYNESYHPWLVVNDEGVIIVVFYDTRYDPPNYLLFDLMAAYSFDGGQTITTNHRISSVSSDVANLKSSSKSNSNFEFDEEGHWTNTDENLRAGVLGEYIGVTAFHDKINAVWTDSRDGNSEVYTANWYLPILEPRLRTPEDSAVINSGPTFSWSTAWKSNEDRYRVEISNDSSFSTGVLWYLSDTNYYQAVIDSPDGTYYWRVKSLMFTGADSSEYSVIRTLIVDQTAPVPVMLISPPDNAQTLDSMPTFDWSDVIKTGTPVVYDLLVSSDSAFPNDSNTTVYTDLTESELVPTDPVLLDSVTFWRVVARDLAENESTSETFSFTRVAYFCGDANHDGSETPNILDLTFIVDFIFRGGPPPDIPAAADLDGSGGNPNILDLTTLVDFIFRGGAQPTCSP